MKFHNVARSVSELFFQNSGERAAVPPEQKQREHDKDQGQRQAGRIEKCVKEQNVYNDRADEGEAERGVAPAQKQQSSGNLKAFHGVEIVADEQGLHKFPGQFALGRRQRDEVKKGVQTEYDED